MKIAILNCDPDKSPVTNGGTSIQKHILGSVLFDCYNGDTISDINQYDGYIITGSPADINPEIPWVATLIQTIHQIHNGNKPCLAICFGMYAVALAFGGKVELAKVKELGFTSIDIDTTSPLFRNLKNPLHVHQSHTDIVTKLPKGATTIAKNDVCIQAFQYKNFYCVQFHPELDYNLAKVWLEKEGNDFHTIINGVAEGYNEPLKIFINFLHITKNQHE